MYSSWHPSSPGAGVNATAHAAAIAWHGGVARVGHAAAAAAAAALTCLQRAGDVMLIPDGWAASFIADTASLAVRGSFYSDRLEFVP
jgi:hypothetical protein